MSVLKFGDRGMECRKLQKLLNAMLVPPPFLLEDGFFGFSTKEAVIRFQALKGLKPDGVVGPKTWKELEPITIAKPIPVPAPAGPSWLGKAKAELGVHEDSAKGKHNQRILEYHGTTSLRARADEIAWCSSFVNWVMIQAGYKGTDSAMARSWLKWGTEITTPKEGAITVIKKKNATSDKATGSTTGFHVAFYISSLPGHVRLLGGNQADQVKYSNFPLSKWDVKGYRWPT